MADTDNPLKAHITAFSHVFAGWFLKSNIRQIQPLNVEFPASPARSDLLFEVLLENGRRVLLHIELQGRSTKEPMPWRMLDYMARFVRRELGERLPDQSVFLQSVVIYIGQGAGVNDRGYYEIAGISGHPSLSWRYEPIRLWQIEAEELIALGHPILLALIGQTRFQKPEKILPQVVNTIRQIENEQQRSQILKALTGLMRSEEAIKMIEQLLEGPEELYDTPYFRRARQQGRAEGVQEGVLIGLREGILEVVAKRFNPGILQYRQISQELEKITEQAVLQRLLLAVIDIADLQLFTSLIAQEVSK